MGCVIESGIDLIFLFALAITSFYPLFAFASGNWLCLRCHRRPAQPFSLDHRKRELMTADELLPLLLLESNSGVN